VGEKGRRVRYGAYSCVRPNLVLSPCTPFAFRILAIVADQRPSMGAIHAQPNHSSRCCWRPLPLTSPQVPLGGLMLQLSATQ